MTPGFDAAEVVSFGDSWTDAGTFGYVYGTNPGGSWSQLLAMSFGVEQGPHRRIDEDDPSGTSRVTAVGGSNYSEGGATMLPDDTGAGWPLSIQDQISLHLADRGRFSSGQLVTIWGGGNDLLQLLDLEARPMSFSVEKVRRVAGAVGAAVQKLLDAGADHVVVMDLLDLGVTAMDPEDPDVGGSSAVRTEMTEVFNEALAACTPDDPRVALVRMSELFDDLARDPTAFGFAVVDGDACLSGMVCDASAFRSADADRTYVFAGFGHFTSHTRELIAQRVTAACEAAWG